MEPKKGTYQLTTSSESLTIYAPKNLARSYRDVRSVAQALDTPSASLATLRCTFGVEKAEALLKLQLVYLNEMLNLKRPLGEAQIDEIATEVLASQPHLTMVDVHVIMRRAMRGHYGEFYESLSMPKVLRWFSDYFEERCLTAAERSRDAHAQVKEYNDTTRKSSAQAERKAFELAHAQYLIEKARKQENRKTGNRN